MKGTLPSVMTHDFSKIPAPQIQRSSFDRSRGVKTTFDAGQLVPIFVDEILPGDTVNMKATFFARIATLLYPIMDNIFLDTFWFFVPNRLLWTNWEKFQGAQDNPGDSIDFEIPTMGGDPFAVTSFSLWDYMGLPLDASYGSNNLPSALPTRAYNLIWNEWFRDQNLQDSAVVDTDDGPDTPADYILRNRGKRHDYFTSALPWPQKGDGVSIPLGTTAPVVGTGITMGFTNNTQNFGMYTVNGDPGMYYRTDAYGDAIATAAPAVSAPAGALVTGVTADPTKSGLRADLSAATAATIAQLREAFATQQLLEIDARSGTRYTEILRGHFGVSVPDFRLQRPEYLGGSSQRLDVRSVPQTAPSNDSEGGNTPLAKLGAYGAVGDQSGFVKSFDEHGYIMCLVNVRADLTYQQGIDRHWSRRTRYDFYMPSFAHLGEQSVLNKEIYFVGGNNAQDEAVFGYQERWAEYRYGVSKVTGAFRSSASTSLEAWHLALNFGALPVLDDGVFIQDDPDIARITALGTVATGQQILMDSYFSMRHARPMPVYSVPGLTRL